MKTLFIILCVIAIIIPCIVYGVAIVNAIQFNNNCISYLKMAADANSVALAEKHLSTAIVYIEDHNLTQGNTTIIFYKPTLDIGFWYDNLKSAQTQLLQLNAKEDLTDLEESNALMKLRETILDGDESVTHPNMISFYPNHVSWFWSLCLIWLVWVLAIIFGTVAYEYY